MEQNIKKFVISTKVFSIRLLPGKYLYPFIIEYFILVI